MKKEFSSQELALKNKMESEAVNLPETLSAANIKALVAGEKQKTPVRKVVKRVIAVAVAACLCLCSFVVLDRAVYAPKLRGKNGEIVYAESYADISGLITDYYKSEKFNSSIQLYSAKKDYVEDVVYEEADNDAPADFQTNHAETNLRVSGVDEADIVKTDGEYIYAATYETLHIIKANDAVLLPQAEIRFFDDKNENVEWGMLGDFYIYGDRLIAEITKDRYAFAEENVRKFSSSAAGVMIYDISDKTDPVFVREILFDGSQVSSRLVNGELLYISRSTVYRNVFNGDDYKTFIPAVYENGDAAYPEAGDIIIASAEDPEEFLTVTKLDLKNDRSAPESLTIFGAGEDIYCTASTLYVFAAQYSYTVAGNGMLDLFARVNGETTTDILAFDITGETPVFKAKGCVNGRLLNTWSIDEYNGYLRLALTGSGNYVAVLDASLNEVGRSEPFAAGENIEGVRFSGSTAYVVTFYQTDPLFVLDLSDVTAPVIRGELKLPGFSSYLHPVGDGLLLGVGEGGTEDGLNGSAKLSLFDVSDPCAPVEVNSVCIENAWFNRDYKSFVSLGNGTFLIPFSRWQSAWNEEDVSYYYSDHETRGALRVGVENGKLTMLGEFSAEYESVYDVRALFIDKTVYTLCTGYSFDWNKTVLFINAYDLLTGECRSATEI